MKPTIYILNQVLPILLMVALGYWIRYKQFFLESTIDEFRKMIVNLALPAVLFISFLDIEMQWDYLIVFGFLFILCLALYGLGMAIRKLFNLKYEYFPFLATGFEYGMLGISLFGAAYGLDKIGYIAVVDLGHEIFIWFVFLPLLLIKRDGAQKPKEIVGVFLSSPVVIAILSGVSLNLAGMRIMLYQWPFTGALIETFNLLGNLTVPLILIIVGYSVNIEKAGISKAIWVALLRLGLLAPLALIVNRYLIREYLGFGPLFEAALFTLLILPPPFIVPLYAPKNLDIVEKQYINNALTVHTLFSLVVFLIYFFLNPPI